MRALIVVNQRCRHGDSDLEPFLERLRAGGLVPRLCVTDRPETIPALLEQHAAEADILVLAGGDGTINAAAATLLALRRPVAILPLGTANDLARTLGIPADPLAAAEVIAAGRPMPIDLGEVNDRFFFNVASIGVAAQVSQDATPEGKRRLGVLNYAAGAARALRGARPFRARIAAGARVVSVSTVQISVGNGRYYGGGMAIADEAAIDDSLLNLYSLAPQSLLRHALLLPLLRAGRHGGRRGVLTLTGSDIRVTTDRPLPVSTDGEITTHTPAHFRVRPRALTVMAPKPRESSPHAA